MISDSHCQHFLANCWQSVFPTNLAFSVWILNWELNPLVHFSDSQIVSSFSANCELKPSLHFGERQQCPTELCKLWAPSQQIVNWRRRYSSFSVWIGNWGRCYSLLVSDRYLIATVSSCPTELWGSQILTLFSANCKVGIETAVKARSQTESVWIGNWGRRYSLVVSDR